MILYLIRHGQTNYNKQRRLQGQTDIELNDYGRELAQVTAEALKDVKFDYAISSPLGRAVETAKIIVGEREIPVLTDDRIQEISFGDFEGLCFGTEGYNIPDSKFQRFFDDPIDYAVPPRGESFQDVLTRTGEFLEELTHDPTKQDQIILISTHGCALKAILANIKKTSVKDFWGEGVHKNCAVSIVSVENGEAKIIEDGTVYYQ